MTPRVNTDEAVDQDKHGTRTTGFGQLEAASEAICVTMNLYFFLNRQFKKNMSTKFDYRYVATH
jgi:hypothetical protein